MANDKVVRIDIPSTAHPGNIRGDGPSHQIARDALDGLYRLAGEIVDTSKQVQSKTRLAEVTTKVAERALGRLDSTVAKLEHHCKTHAAAIDSAVMVPTDPHVAAQVRSYFSNQEAPVRAILAALKDGDARVASAVLSAPSLLSGLTSDQVTLVSRAAAEQFAADAVAKLAASQDCLRRVVQARDDFGVTMAAQIKSWSDSDTEKLTALAQKG